MLQNFKYVNDDSFCHNYKVTKRSVEVIGNVFFKSN